MVIDILIAIAVLAVIALICAIVLTLASTFFGVKENEKVLAVRDCLPGANCGACGYSGCDGYAKALGEGQTDNPSLCTPGGADVAAQLSEIMGLAAGEFCDHVIITEDDPAGESLADICAEIAENVKKTGTPYDIVYQRDLAIQRAFSLLEEGGVLLLCGKGAETSQKRKNGSEAYEGDEFLARKQIELYDKNKITVSL